MKDHSWQIFTREVLSCARVRYTRQQRFERRYLFSGTAFNLINLVLSSDVDDE